MSCHLVWSCVVGENLLVEVEECLEGSVEVVEDRRGFGKDRGVPDSVFWLRPSDDRISRSHRVSRSVRSEKVCKHPELTTS
jgi:hypothetical protein